MMVVTVRSLGLNGVSGYEVSAECFLSGGLPAFDVVGLPDAAVREARERVRAAVKNCGAKFPVSRITVNLAPAGQKKAGTLYDLPIFVGLLAAGGVAYTAGILFYKSQRHYMHFVWHLFVLAGSILQYACIALYCI